MEKYGIYKIAKMIGVSSTAIYKIINSENISKDLEQHISINEKGHKKIDVFGIDILKNHFNISIEVENKIVEENVNQIANTQQEFINSLQNQVNKLNKQLESKDIQINDLIEAVKEQRQSVKEAHMLNENNQTLLRESQRRTLLLEEENQKGFWRRLFKN